MGVGGSSNAESKLEQDLVRDGPLLFPGESGRDERYFGLENFGNTCYCNSVLQALFFCQPLKDQLLREIERGSAAHPPPSSGRKGSRGTLGLRRSSSVQTLDNGSSSGSSSGDGASGSGPIPHSSMLWQLGLLFADISTQKKKTGSLAPTQLLQTLKASNEQFQGNLQQDAHEFLNFLLNDMADTLVEAKKEAAAAAAEATAGAGGGAAAAAASAASLSPSVSSSLSSSVASTYPPSSATVPHPHPQHYNLNSNSSSTSASMGGGGAPTFSNGDDCDPTNAPPKSWVHELFEGVLTNETRCLCCEAVTNRDEPFMDLSVDIEEHSSLTACLRNFSSTETLTLKNKFFCEPCNALQEAEKQMKLKRLPRILTLHLKRFKYVEQMQNFGKLSHRVVFPLELKVPNVTAEAMASADEMLYRLFAVVVHIGRGPNQGHYVAIVKSQGRWLLYDDDVVELVDESVLSQCFGVSGQQASGGGTNTGYILLYDSG